MIHRGQRLSDEAGVGFGLVPVYPAHRVIIFAGRVAADLPATRAGSTGLIDEADRRLFERQVQAVPHERMRPAHGILVAAPVHELLVLAVRDLVDVHEEVTQRQGVELLEARGPDLGRATAHPRHAGGKGLFRVETEGAGRGQAAREVGRLTREVTLELEPDAGQSELESLHVHRSAAQLLPFGVGGVVAPERHRARRVRLEGQGARYLGPHGLAHRVIRDDAIEVLGDGRCGGVVVFAHQAPDLVEAGDKVPFRFHGLSCANHHPAGDGDAPQGEGRDTALEHVAPREESAGVGRC